MRTSISKKASQFMIATIGIAAVCLLIVGFISVWKMRLDTIGTRQKQDAKIFSVFIAQQIDGQVEDMKALSNDSSWHETLKGANLRYENWEPKAIKEYMAHMDDQWAAAGDSQLQEWLGPLVSRRLKTLANQHAIIAEIFMTDKYGGLVAASNRTSDFYQADENWWQRAYNNGKGDDYFGEVELDESIGVLGSAVAIPIKDETGQVIGISKIVLDIAVFFQPLMKYQFGKTGHVELLDAHGNVIYHPSLIPMDKSDFSGFELDHLLRSKNGFEVIREGPSKIKNFTSAAKVNSSILNANGINWILIVTQSEREVFLPLYKIFGIGLILTLAVFLLLVVIMQSKIKDIFVYPLQKIRDGVQRFSNGEQDYKIDLKTGDEIEDLADAFNKMNGQLEKTTTSVNYLNKEISERKKAEDAIKKTEERLSRALKDEIGSRKIVVSMLADNNQIRERLEKSLEELKGAQTQIINAEKMQAIGRMASGIAHEVKNPLGIILQGINYFEGELPPESKDNHDTLQMMKDSVKRADNIVRALLDFSKTRDPKMEPHDINAIIKSSVNLVQNKFRTNSIEPVYELGKDLPNVSMDREKIEQVLINLFNNAADAMPKGGKLYVRSYLSELKEPKNKIGGGGNNLFRLGEKVMIVEVEDTGVGIDEHIINKIFDPFFTTKNRTEGTGLGLSIVSNIIDMHRGLVEVESKNGKGAKFTLVFKVPEKVSRYR